MGVIAWAFGGSHRNGSFVQCNGYQLFWRNILPLIFKGHLNIQAVCSPIPFHPCMTYVIFKLLFVPFYSHVVLHLKYVTIICTLKTIAVPEFKFFVYVWSLCFSNFVWWQMHVMEAVVSNVKFFTHLELTTLVVSSVYVWLPL